MHLSGRSSLLLLETIDDVVTTIEISSSSWAPSCLCPRPEASASPPELDPCAPSLEKARRKPSPRWALLLSQAPLDQNQTPQIASLTELVWAN
jgi:hypothetical protein